MNDTARTVVVALLSAVVGALLVLAFGNGPVRVRNGDTGLQDLDELRERISVLEQRSPMAAAVAPADDTMAAAVADEEAAGGAAAGESRSRTPVSDNRAARVGSQLREAGWTDAEIDSLTELRERAALEMEQYQYEAMQRTLRENPDELSRWRNRRTLMRETLGEEKYEQYLEAAGRPTAAEIRNVLAGSAGKSAGLQPGDKIRSYGSTRVYDDMDLMFAQIDGKPGEPVSLEIDRNGTVFYVTVPRGPLGITRRSRFGPDF